MKEDIQNKYFIKFISKFKPIENEDGLQINPVPDLPCYVYCGEYGIVECENGHIDLGLEELVAMSWILEDDLLELIKSDN